MSSGAFSTLRLLGAIPALVLGMACSSSGPTDPPRACTLIGCEDGLKVDLEPGSGWPEGAYLFIVNADGAEVMCRGSIPLPACTGGRATTCEPAGVVTITESGCALPASAQGFSQISFEPNLRPRTVRLSIVETSSPANPVVADALLTPEFKTTEPNGPGCPPTCTQAQGRVTLRFFGTRSARP